MDGIGSEGGEQGMNDTCVVCGEYVPEGRQVCVNCCRQTEDQMVRDALNKIDTAQAILIQAKATLSLVGNR